MFQLYTAVYHIYGMCGLYTHTFLVTPHTSIAPQYFIYIPQYMLPAVCVNQPHEHFSQSIHFDCTSKSFICAGVCVATSTTHFHCMHNSYIAVYLCGLCGYSHHTIYIVCTTCIPQHTSAVCVLLPPHNFHCMPNSYTAVYTCEQCGCVYNFKTFHTLSMYVSFVSRSILLSAVCVEYTHDTHTVVSIHTL